MSSVSSDDSFNPEPPPALYLDLHPEPPTSFVDADAVLFDMPIETEDSDLHEILDMKPLPTGFERTFNGKIKVRCTSCTRTAFLCTLCFNNNKFSLSREQ